MTAAVARPLYPREAPAGRRRGAWAESFGVRWWLDVGVMALLVFCFAAARPLADPDLPMHLRVGEWIVAHRTVPFVEPFAWTRAGAPYYAYSWLPQTIFFVTLDRLGHLGLRALHGLLLLSAAAAVMLLARVAGWRPSQAVILAGLHVIVASYFVALLRPQLVLMVVVPLAWAATIAIGDHRRVGASLALLWLASAVAANSHLFFPITLGPVAWLWVRPPARRWHAAAAVAATVGGWLTSPYALVWPRVYALNFAPNAMTRPPSAITELQPGFLWMVHPPQSLIVVVIAMLLLPWALAGARLDRRERAFAAAAWTVGLIGFGYATRLFIVWWLLAIVPVGWAVAHLTRHTADAAPRARFRVLGLAACVLMIGAELRRTADVRALEGTTRARTLPSIGALPAGRLARWLDGHTVAGARGRVITAFGYGSLLAWRLPAYSMSIDTRGVFPDSVSAAEAIVGAADRDVPLGPIASADLAILPLRFRAAAVLDTATGWRRHATTAGTPEARDSAALWAKAGWWARNASAR